MSGMVMIGKSSPHGLPVAGLVEAGPVDPMQPPITFEQMMKYWLVSSGSPGPTIVSHQPGFPVIGCVLKTCWSPVSAWQIRIALERSALSSP